MERESILVNKSKSIINLLTGYNLKLLDLSLLVLRLTAGFILFMVGSGKVLGWFSGSGIDAAIQSYNKMGFSLLLTYLSCYTEFVGGILIMLGFLTRPVCVLVIINMAVATSVMIPNGFLGPYGASYPFVFFIIAVVILIAGPMHFSVDTIILKLFYSKDKD